MKFRFRASEERDLPPPSPGPPHHHLSPPLPPLPFSSSGLFADQAMQVSYSGVEGLIASPPRGSLDELERVLQEERIKEEILIRRIAQRRMLEEQARRDREIERVIVLERFQADRFHDPVLVMPPEDRAGRVLCRRKDEFDHQLPLRSSPNIERGKALPLSLIKSKVETINETNLPNEKPAGTKRKIGMTASGTSGAKVPRAAPKDWSCALCQVSVTSEEGLKYHLKGKKHLAKAAQLGSSKKGPALLKSKSGSCSSSSMPKLASPQKKGPKGEKKVSIQVDGKIHEVVERGIFLWCTLCNMKCNSKDMMASHMRGKKHLSEESKKAEKPKVEQIDAVKEDERVEKGEEHVKEDDEKPILGTDGECKEES